ncbi:alpha/beta hydrolase [Porcipelethomonas sp.]|uniref:alpha/beta hydrolase n=1 Tax=Porcipelethomonas sp. TaxID=2981675 RepID=UPI003EF521EB
MKSLLVAAGIAGGIAAAGCAAAVGAATLFKRVIPRQDEVRVDLNEMADMAKWEEYKKIIHPNKEWLMQRNMEEVTIRSRDGLTLHGYYFASDNPTDKLVIAFHGYTSCGLNDCSSISAFLLKQGFDCLIVDNRSHGKSDGKYIGFGILDRYDCMSWIKYVNNRFEGKKQILLFGISMGGATVLMASGFPDLPDNVKAVIADCAFTSPYDVFAHILKRDYKMLPFPVMNINDALCRRKAGYGFKDYSTLTAMQTNKCPTLFIHGKDDNFVPTWMSEKNYEVCAAPKELLIVENAGHAASYYENVPLYEKKVSEFLGKYMSE